MKKTGRNKLLTIIIPGICGIAIADLFLRLYGVTIAYLIEVKAMAWINSVPKGVRVFTFWAQSFVFEAIVFAFVSVIICGIGGIFLKINYKVASIIAFGFFLLTKALYSYRAFGEFLFVNSSITYFVLISITSIIIIWGSFHIGGIIYRVRR